MRHRVFEIDAFQLVGEMNHLHQTLQGLFINGAAKGPVGDVTQDAAGILVTHLMVVRWVALCEETPVFLRAVAAAVLLEHPFVDDLGGGLYIFLSQQRRYAQDVSNCIKAVAAIVWRKTVTNVIIDPE